MPTTKPYCACVRGKQDGWTRGSEGYFVCSKCGKASRFIYERVVVPKMLVGSENFDKIVQAKKIFTQRVTARTTEEYKILAQQLNVDVRLVQKIWEENDWNG